MARRKQLAVNTTVGEVTYKAGSFPPPEVAEQITNPKCWKVEPKADPPEPEPEPQREPAVKPVEVVEPTVEDAEPSTDDVDAPADND